jgi:hypothetical protein
MAYGIRKSVALAISSKNFNNSILLYIKYSHCIMGFLLGYQTSEYKNLSTSTNKESIHEITTYFGWYQKHEHPQGTA